MVVGSWEHEGKALHNFDPAYDRAQERVTRAALGAGLLLFVTLLVTESDGDGGCNRPQVRVVAVNGTALAISEFDVAFGDGFRFAWTQGLDVLAASHGKKEGTND